MGKDGGGWADADADADGLTAAREGCVCWHKYYGLGELGRAAYREGDDAIVGVVVGCLLAREARLRWGQTLSVPGFRSLAGKSEHTLGSQVDQRVSPSAGVRVRAYR